MAEKRHHVTLVDVLADVLSDHFGVGLESVEISVSELGGHLEADVKELTEVLVVGRVGLIVAKGTGVLLTAPAIDLFGSREFRVINVDNCSVWLA